MVVVDEICVLELGLRYGSMVEGKGVFRVGLNRLRCVVCIGF